MAPGGSDANAGDLGHPYATLSKCLSVATRCAVRAGTYREVVVPPSGATLSAYDGEVVTLDGTDPVTGWTVYQGSIYRAAVTLTGDDTDEVFVNGEMVMEARWPNSHDPFHPIFAKAGSGTVDGQLFDTNLPSGNWSGAKVWLWSGNDPWDPITGMVTVSQAGQLTYTADGAVFPPYIQAIPGGYYYLFGALAALDAPREWYYDPSGKLYLWAPKGADPSSLDVRAKQRPTCIKLDGKSNVTVQSLHLFGCNLTTDAASTGNVIDRLDALYPSHFTRMFDGPYPHDYWYRHLGDTGIVLFGSENTLQNSTIAWSAGNGVTLNGTHQTVKNNLIHHVDYAGNYCSGIAIAGTGHTVQYNTVHTSARFNVFAHSILNYPVIATSGLDISYNNSFEVMLFSRDGGHFYVGGPPAVTGSRIHHNWFHGAQALYSGPADDYSLAGVYMDEDSPGWEVDENVVWNNQYYNIFVHGSTSSPRVTSPNDENIHNNTIPDLSSNAYIWLQGVDPYCGTTSVTNNLVLVAPQQTDSTCSVTNNGPTALGATEMTAAVTPGCDFTGCASDPPPAISGAQLGASIARAPHSALVPVGQSATFTALGAGSQPLSYQWRRDGADIPGATNAIYSTPSTVAGDDGTGFAVRITNSLGSVTSSAATLSVE